MRVWLAVFFAVIANEASAQTAPVSRIQSLLQASENMPPERLMAPWIEKDKHEQNQNLVLNEMEAGTLAFLSGYLTGSEALFSDAQQQIETIFSENATASQARSKFVPESSKEFKGDPYERAMVGYYLGLIDMSKGEYDNARAGFRFAMLQDTMSASETYQDDMALMQYLVGWTYWCEGNRNSAMEEFSRARKIRPALALPENTHNVIMLAELGKAPHKLNDGKYGELLRYEAGTAGAEQQVSFSVNSRQLAGQLAEDLYFQASTRGGAAVDSIRAGKASFRDAASNIASAGAGIAALSAGAALVSEGNASRQFATVGAVVGLASLVSSSVARSTETQADSRAWKSLPSTIHLATAAYDGNRIEAGFFGANGRFLYSQPMLVRRGPNGLCAVAHARAGGSRNYSSAMQWQAMPGNAQVLAEEKKDKPAEISDQGAKMLDMIRMMRENPGHALPET